MSDATFLRQVTRLKRILRSCGWTFHPREKPSGWYARAAKRDATGKWHGAYIAPFHRLDEMDSASIKAILPEDVA